jgi:purine nucleosidase/pyrimidine-specific ribonucleoside hydrolase
MTSRPTPIIIDTDPGHDDALALLLAFQSPELRVLAVTSVAGNQTLEKTTLNARRILTIARIRDVPIAAGMGRPLVRELHTAPTIHGESGLDGYDFPPPEVGVVPEHAVDLIVRTATASPEPITLVPVGPLTNIALAFLRAPEITKNISRIVLMGGAVDLGNVTPSAEFNIYVDPEAAQIVFDAGVPITMVGLDATRKARLRADERERIRGFGTDVGTMVGALMDFYTSTEARRDPSEGPPIHDALAVAAVVRPELLQTQHVNVVVETVGVYTAGRTVCDMRGTTGRPSNADVALGVDRAGFMDLLISRLARY